MNQPTTPEKIMELGKASQWLVKAKKATDGVSPLGDKVAQILDCIWGIHNVPLAKSVLTQWNDNYVIEIVLDTCSLSMIDDSRLTYLVVLCEDHIKSIRVHASLGDDK